MNAPLPTPAAQIDVTREIDAALAILGSVQPRDGMEQRVLARIADAPVLPWYQRLAFAPGGSQRWMVAAASVVVVAGAVGMTAYRNHASAPVAAPVLWRAPHPAQQPVAAAAAVGVSNHPLQTNPARTRHRGVRRSYRAAHERAPLPRGTGVPLRPRTLPGVP